MAIYHVKTTGNDTNPGTFASPWLTLARAFAATGPTPYLANGDTIFIHHGTFNLTASISSQISHNILAYPGASPEFGATGAFTFQIGYTGSSTSLIRNIYWSGVKLNASLGGTYGNKINTALNPTFFKDCIFEHGTLTGSVAGTIAGNGTRVIAKNCQFKVNNLNGYTATVCSNTLAQNSFFSFENCQFDNYTNFYNSSTGQAQVLSYNSSFKNFLNIYGSGAVANLTALQFSELKNNTFYNCTNLITYSGAGNITHEGFNISKNLLGFTKLVNNTSTGVLTFAGILSDGNVALATTNITNFNSTGLTTVANYTACQFYDLTSGSEDLRILISSPLATYPNYIGANPPEWDPTIWISNIPDNKVEAGYPSRYLSLTNNRTGSLATGGETDVNKVLTTSTAVSGTINPNTVLDTNVNGTLPQSAVKASNGGTLPLNKIAPTQGGSYLGQESNDLLIASKLKLGESILNLGFTVNGTYDPITGNWEAISANDLRIGVAKLQNGSTITGLLNLPIEDHVKASVSYDNGTKTGNRTDASVSNVLTGSGTFGANGTEFIPIYSPDFPLRINVAPDDTVDGLSGTMDLPALNRVSPNATLRGATGTQDLPALNRVSPNDTLEGVQGTQDLPSLSSILDTDTLEGSSGTANVNSLANLPATNKVIDGIAYGLNLEFTGTAIELDLTKFTDLSSSKVEDGYQYKYNSSTNNRTGALAFNLANFTQLIPAEVKNGKIYLYDGVSYTGTLGQAPTIPADNVIAGLVGLIEEKVTLILPIHKPLQYVNEIEKNTWTNNQKRYGVLVGTATEVSGPIGHNSISQEFEIILTDGFMNKPLSDAIQRSKTLKLQDNLQTIYKELCKNSLVFNYTYFNVKDFSASQPEFIEQDNVCVLRMRVNITYRQKL